MTPTEFRQLRQLLGLSQSQLARELCVHKDTVSKWERGVLKVGPLVAKHLRLLTN